MYTLSNFAAILFAVRFNSVEDFGLVAIVVSATVLVTLLERALVGDPVAISLPDEVHGVGAAQAMAAASVIGMAAGTAGCAMALAVWGGGLGAVTLSGAAAVTGVVVTDALRHVHVAGAAPQRALCLDVAWVTLQIAAMVALVVWSPSVGRAPLSYLAWAAPATLVAAGELVRLRIVPRLGQAPAWFRHHRRVSGGLLVDYSVMQGLLQILTLALGSMVGLGAAGAFKGAQALFGPFRMVSQAANLAGVPEVARMRRTGQWRRRRSSWALSIPLGLSVVVMVYAALLLGLPDVIGARVLGRTWPQASALVLPFSVVTVTVVLGIGPRVLLRAITCTGAVAVGRGIGAGLTLAISLLVIHPWGATGVVWAMAAGSLVSLAWWAVSAGRRRTWEVVHDRF